MERYTFAQLNDKWSDGCYGMADKELDWLGQQRDFKALPLPDTNDPSAKLIYEQAAASVATARANLTAFKADLLFNTARALREFALNEAKTEARLADLIARRKRAQERITIDRIDSFRVRIVPAAYAVAAIAACGAAVVSVACRSLSSRPVVSPT